MPGSEGHSTTKDAGGVKLGFGVPNFGFQNYAFLTNAIRQFTSGAGSSAIVLRPISMPFLVFLFSANPVACAEEWEFVDIESF
jgi:hypothetical protein